MKKIFIIQGILIIVLFAGSFAQAQKHIANGEIKKGGNRLISVLSETGKQLYQPDRYFFPRNITADGKMNEPEWEQALVVTPFITDGGMMDNSSVRVLYGPDNIYLFWMISNSGGLSSQMTDKDGIITTDDYVQVDLKPWLPDSISHGVGYYYTIAVNPEGIVWDSYFDPYLDGFFFSSWNSGVRVSAGSESDYWKVEMIIPFSGLDVHSDPGWKWNLEFHHGMPGKGSQSISSSNIGVTVQQDEMVRHPGLVSYFWPRPEFIQEVKPDMSKVTEKSAELVYLTSLPRMNGKEDIDTWKGAGTLDISHTDKMGKDLTSKSAHAKIGMKGSMLCFNLQGDGANIQKNKDTEGELGKGMAAQMSGVNGVFIDQALFQNECFWIIIQPRNTGADKIHQDYYLLQINNNGVVRGTYYDKYGAPTRSWEPKIEIDLYNTNSGWGTEMLLDLGSLDISVDYNGTWGMNLFRNRMIGENDSELQAWKYTGGDFVNPDKFGELSGIEFQNLSVFLGAVERQITQLKSLLPGYIEMDQQTVQDIQIKLNALKTGSTEQLRKAESELQQINHMLGILESAAHYQSIPHPAVRGLPLMDVQFIGEHGWAVGAMGTILRTEDGGNTWQTIQLKFDADLYRVKFINKNQGWAVGGRIRIAETNEGMRHDQRGGYAYIFHSIDGGKTWECQFGERGRHLFALDFSDEHTGYAAGERGYFMKTIDGGKHWEILPTTESLNWLYGMTFLDQDNGFVVGSNETVLKTADGGRTWQKLDAGADSKFYDFRPIYRDISFNGNTGCIVGQYGSIVISHDQGQSWKPSGTFYKNDVRELMDLRSVQFTSPMRGYAVGELGTRIMTSDDGGLNLVMVGERGKIIESTDLGLNWRQLHGQDTKIDILVLMAHGDDGPLTLNSLYAHYTINEDKKIVDIEVITDLHSSEYEETYNLEHDRNAWMTGIGTSTNFIQFESGNNGANYYHYTQRLWEGEDNMERHMVAAIRAYRPDIVITHSGILGDYDKPGHKVSGRAGLRAFENAGGTVDRWPELTRLGLQPWEAKKLYCTASESYPATIDLS